MANKANQHYVPQFYLRYFSLDSKSICVLNRKNGKTIETAPIKGQASKKYYYGDVDTEDRISEIEGHFSKALREIKETNSFEQCTPENYVLLLQNIMLQKSRTVSERKKWKAMEDRMYQLYMECEVNNDDALDEETKEGFRKITQTLEADPKQYQAMGMSIAFECADSLVDLLPVILHNKTNRPFIFGDSPVILTNPLLKQVTLRGVLGTQTLGLIVLYPLSPQHCVMLIDEAAYKIKKFHSSVYSVRNLRDVALINKLQIHNAASAVYFSEHRYSQYATELWRQEKTKLIDHIGKVVEAPGIDHNGEPMGDIIHSFEEQLPLIPKFSFLEYKEMPESEYQFSRRQDYA
jgi:hypothetical protein